MDANNIFGNNNITLTNPVKVFNFESKDNPISSIVAAYLAVHLNNIDSLKEILLPKTKMNDVTDHSLLFFDKRHAYEVCCILDGILDYFQGHSYILVTNRRNFIKQIFNITNECNSYSDFKFNIKTAVTEHLSLLPKQFFNAFLIILEYIWFIPYTGITELYIAAENLYNEEIKKENGENN